MICRKCKCEIQIHPFLTVGYPFPTEEDKKTPGMVYSDAGYEEAHISGFCETCFDKLFQEEDEEKEQEDTNSGIN